ncbi:phosphatidylinositol-specific phospholipase C domain-containing protein [Parabacteroides sp. PF5-6]|uniref:phosphatidylinositol-specific phospholipase C n=1 Tax=Parabacteroides sp. PF5-6 TaxID=1742403 RepID=UPI0024060925|nr:phosphatidylinositol-specific phospholipase C domain-containing protein [Parabacteroides sp. PF5-6]MDF9828775.1 1-phosphatidylinositol phosphodiesterase [Parabacteroides sp. PF5-6]
MNEREKTIADAAKRIEEELKAKKENLNRAIEEKWDTYKEDRKRAEKAIAAMNKDIKAFKQRFSLSNWMEFVDDEKFLSEINLPGTHDSGAYFSVPLADKLWKDQDRTIAEQLKDGIRYLDVRCTVTDNSLDIYHGVIDQMLSFFSVCADCYNFLTANPTETILMSIKDESNDALATVSKVVKNIANTPADWTFIDAFLREISGGEPIFWYTRPEVPRLKDVRGKIVLVRNFEMTGKYANQPLGLDFRHPDTGLRPFVLKDQDQYEKVSLEEKWDCFYQLLKDAMYTGSFVGSERIIWRNYASMYDLSKGILPQRAANYMNPRLKTILKAEKAPRRYGWILMDFYDPEIALLLARSNIRINN